MVEVAAARPPVGAETRRPRRFSDLAAEARGHLERRGHVPDRTWEALDAALGDLIEALPRARLAAPVRPPSRLS